MHPVQFRDRTGKVKTFTSKGRRRSSAKSVSEVRRRMRAAGMHSAKLQEQAVAKFKERRRREAAERKRGYRAAALRASPLVSGIP